MGKNKNIGEEISNISNNTYLPVVGDINKIEKEKRIPKSRGSYKLRGSTKKHTRFLSYSTAVSSRTSRGRGRRLGLYNNVGQRQDIKPSKEGSGLDSEVQSRSKINLAKSLKHPKNVIDTKLIENSISFPTYEQLKESLSAHFGTMGRLAEGQKLKILGRRISPDNKVEYLIQWQYDHILGL